jgi:uncharacterized membrane protein YhfC
MLPILPILNALLMIGLPLALGWLLAARHGLSWRLYVIGSVTFVLSQVAHIPFNMLLLGGAVLPPAGQWPLPVLAVTLGVSAGLFEETARLLVYRFWIRAARSWSDAVMFGAGHGGGEAIILGVLAAVATINLLVLGDRDLAALELSPEQLAALRAQLEAFQNAPWYASLLGAVERVFAITFHVAAAVLVLQAVRRRNPMWLIAAIIWHATLNAVAFVVQNLAGSLWAEGALGGLTLISAGMIYALREPATPGTH